jgi:hypothetical protein
MSLLLSLTTGGGGAVNYSLTCATGSYAVTGNAALLNRGYSLSCNVGAYNVTGQTALLKHGYALTCAAGSYAVSGVAATLTYTPGSAGPVNYSLTCATGSYAVAGVAAVLSLTRRLGCSAGSYVLTGNVATLTYTPGSPGAANYSLTCAAGSYVITGYDAVLTFTGLVTERPQGAGHGGKNARKRAYRLRERYEDAIANPLPKSRDESVAAIMAVLAGPTVDGMPVAVTNKVLSKLLALPNRVVAEVVDTAETDRQAAIALAMLYEQYDEEDILLLL